MKPRILIIDDEQAIMDTIQYALETEGCETLAALAGEPALDLLQKERIDLIILDVGLPDINGMDLLKVIRRESDIPVVFLTARSADIDRILGLELGGDDYVVKPFSPRELAARVKAVLRRSRSGKSATVNDAGAGKQGAGAGMAANRAPRALWNVDKERRSISYRGTGLELSRYEYSLLLEFLRHPGQVFSREQLMSRVWDEPETSMDRTVDAHIKNLRAKFRAVHPDDDPIITHRGVGYSLKEEA